MQAESMYTTQNTYDLEGPCSWLAFQRMHTAAVPGLASLWGHRSAA